MLQKVSEVQICNNIIRHNILCAYANFDKCIGVAIPCMHDLSEFYSQCEVIYPCTPILRMCTNIMLCSLKPKDLREVGRMVSRNIIFGREI